MKQLPIVYSQRDPKWASQRLGTVDGQTIGQSGCYITSFADWATYFGHTITPAALDDMFTNNGWYVSGDLLTDDGLQKAFPDVVFQGTDNYQTTPADLNKLKGYLQDNTIGVVIEIDLGGGYTHFAPVVDCDGSTVTIANPWTGAIENFTQTYGDPTKNILKFVVYKGNPTTTSPSSDTIPVKKADFENLVHKSTLYDAFNNAGFASVDVVNAKIADLNKQISDLQHQTPPPVVTPPTTNPTNPQDTLMLAAIREVIYRSWGVLLPKAATNLHLIKKYFEKGL